MKLPLPAPPRLALLFLKSFLRPELTEEVVGDLEEKFFLTCKKKTLFRARLNYWLQVIHYLRPFAIRRFPLSYLNQHAMLQNYFKIGMRHVFKHKAFSFINVFGLAIALSVCMLVIVMLVHQKSFDQFHEKKERIYRILSDRENSKRPSATTPYAVAPLLKNHYPAIEEVTSLTLGVGGEAAYNQQAAQLRGYFADAAFFNVFGYELEQGNRRTALATPNTLVLTAETAHRLFRDENPLGKTVNFTDRGLSILGGGSGDRQIDWGLYTITGVLADKDYRSHLKFDALMSAASRDVLEKDSILGDIAHDWQNNTVYTYTLLAEGKQQEDLQAVLNDVIAHRQEELKDVKGFTLVPQPLTAITPGIMVGNEPSYSLPMMAYYFLGILALVIIISACLNYTNLTAARALTRAKEVGVRKVTGAFRGSVVAQFICESVIMSLLALVMAVLLLLLLKPAFEGMWINQYLQFNFQEHWTVYLIFTVLALFTGVIAGMYPALFISRYQPVAALKNAITLGSYKIRMRKVLSVSQFVISFIFITTAVVIYKQFNHFIAFDYGFQVDNVINVPLQANRYDQVMNAFGKVPGVTGISACNYLPSTGSNNGISLRRTDVSKDEYKYFVSLLTDENFIGNLHIDLVAGRNLLPTDSTTANILVNEAAVKELGFDTPANMIGQVVESEWGHEQMMIVGVVKDFRVKSPFGEDRISPLMLRNEPNSFANINVSLSSAHIHETLGALEEEWDMIDPAHAFQYSFYEDQLAGTYRGILDIVSVIGFLAFLAITIACLGMLGMAIYATERKRKEIGIRKVMGAADRSIALFLSREFLVILLISIGVGMPLSYLLNSAWLESFPNRVAFGVDTCLIGTLVLLMLGLLTIGSQTIKASKRNSIEALKSE